MLASNEYGLTSTTVQTNFFDTTSPLLAITNISSGDVISNTYTYGGTNYDPFAPITGFWYSNSALGGAWRVAGATNTGSTPWTYTTNTGLIANGEFIFAVKSSNIA